MSTLRPDMWRRCLAACLAIALALAGCANPQQQPRSSPSITLVGIVVDGVRAAADGEPGLVRIWRDGRAIEARSGIALARGDTIETGGRADAMVRFPNGSVLYMRPDSHGRIGSLSEAVGEFFARIKGVFSIESSFVRAAANGTAFAVRAQPDGAMSVTVHEGNVFVDSTRGTWARISLGPGSTLTAHERASPPAQASQAELRNTQRWVDNVDQILRQPRADSSGGSSVAGAVAVGVAIAAAAALLSGRDKDKPSRDESDSTRPGPVSPALAAPTARGPGDPNSPPVLSCRGRDITLSWGSVDGARDYLVTLQKIAAQRQPWTTVATPSTANSRINTALDDGRYRWSVQARNTRGSGPPSAVLYFDCYSRVAPPPPSGPR